MIGEETTEHKDCKESMSSTEDEGAMMEDIVTFDEAPTKKSVGLKEGSKALNDNAPNPMFENVGSHRPQNLNDEDKYSKEEGKTDDSWTKAIGSAIHHHIRDPLGSFSASSKALGVAVNEHIKEPIDKVLQPVATSRRSASDDMEIKEWKMYDPYADKNSTFSWCSGLGFFNNFERPKYGTIATESPSSSPTPIERFKKTRSICIPDNDMPDL